MTITKKRHSFILLETLLTIAVIALTSTTLLHAPAKIYQKNLKDLFAIELSRVAQTLFIEIENSLKKDHPWELLSKQQDRQIPLKEIPITLHPYIKTSYQSTYQLTILKEKEGENNTCYKLLNCQISFYDKGMHPFSSFNYSIFVEKRS